MLTVHVLGPLALRRNGADLPVPAGKTTELLIRLALEAGTPVRADRLIEDLWAGEAAGVARNTLQAKVSNLRRALGERDLLIGGSLGYTLSLAPDCVDALLVLRLADEADGLRTAGDHEGALELSARGLAMFSGELLAAAGDGEWLAPHRARLEAAQRRLTETGLAARTALGGGADLLAELEAAVAEHPLHEDLWRLLITALYRAGRQADALAAHRRVRQLLADELGLEPGPELRTLEGQILRQDDVLAAPVRRLARATPGNLPATSSSLVGRTAELAELTTLLAEMPTETPSEEPSGRPKETPPSPIPRRRLVTVVGVAGVGKTRLALELAGRHRPPGGAWLVRLESARTVTDFWQVLGEALGLPEAGQARVLDRLLGNDLLLVLDNCEQLVEVLAEPITRLLAVPGLRVLATSQLPIGLDGELVYPLEPLPVADSVLLFTERATSQRGSFVLDDGTGAVIEAVCRSLDGLPLAIELAAARAKVLSVQEIARRLDDRFALLAEPAARRSPRHRTLAAAIGWSYDLLLADDQRGLWALAGFRAGAPLSALEHVLAALQVPAGACLDVLDRLADRSLVTLEVVSGAGGDAGAVRYRMLDSVREFSLGRLAASGLGDVAAQAHAGWLAAAADRAREQARGPDQARPLSLVRAERANIDAALSWTASREPGTGTRIVLGFGWIWAVLGAGAEGAARIRSALAADPSLTAQDRIDGYLLASWLEAAGGDLARAVADVEQATASAAEGQDAERDALALVYLAFVRTQQGRPRDVLALVQRARAELARFARRWEEGASWLLSAWAETALGSLTAAREACAEAMTRLGDLGDRWALIHADALLGGLAQAEHRFNDAVEHHARAAKAAHELGFAAAAALHLANLGRAWQQAGDLAAARASLERAIDAGIATGDLRLVALARVRLGRVLRATGEPDAARSVLELAARWYISAGGGEGQGLAGQLLAVLDADVDRLQAVLATARQAQDAEVQLLTLDALAAVLADQGRTERARAALQAADALAPAAQHLITDTDRIDAARARRRLGAPAPEPG